MKIMVSIIRVIEINSEVTTNLLYNMLLFQNIYKRLQEQDTYKRLQEQEVTRGS